MPITWVTREQSGLAAPNPSRLSVRTDKVVGVTVHETGSDRTADPAAALALWRELQREAMSGQNPNNVEFGDIEYNAGVTDFGQILLGRDNAWVGAHASSSGNVANRTHFGVAYLGRGDPTPDAIRALDVYVYAAWLTIGHRPIIMGHRDWQHFGGIVTACPLPILEAHVETLNG